MKSLKDTLKSLWKDESAQGMTEYILLVVVVLAIAMMFKKEITGFISTKLGTIGSDMQNFTSQ